MVTGLGLLTAGCGGSQSSVASDATTIVATEISTIRAVPIIEIGGDSVLTFVHDLAVDRHGLIYVTDRYQESVIVFDADGSERSRIGRRGDGPGEFRTPSLLGTNGDTLFVRGGAGHVHLYHLSGAWVRSFLVEEGLTPAHGMVATSRGLAMITRVGRPSRTMLLDSVAVRFVDQETVTLGPPVAVAAMPRLTPGLLGPEAMVGSPVPFFAVARDGRIYRTTGESFEITVWSPDGRLLRTARAEVPRVSVSSADVDESWRILERTAAIARLPLPDRSSYRPERAEYRPALGRIILDENGSLIVQRRDLLGSGDDAARPVVWDHLDPTWHITARFLTSPDVRLYAMRNCRLYGVHSDGIDADRITVLELQPCPADMPRRD